MTNLFLTTSLYLSHAFVFKDTCLNVKRMGSVLLYIKNRDIWIHMLFTWGAKIKMSNSRFDRC